MLFGLHQLQPVSRKQFFIVLVVVMLLGGFLRCAFWDRQGVTSDEIYTMASSSGYNLHLYSWWPDSYDRPFDPIDPVKPAFYRNDVLKLYDTETFWDGLKNNIQSPLYPIIIRGLRETFNPSVLQLRLLSVFASLLALPMAFILGRRIRGDHFGLMLTVVFAFSGMLVYFSHIARLYSMLILITLIATWALMRIAPLGSSDLSVKQEDKTESPDWFAWVTLVVMCLLSMYIHYAFFFTMVFFFCYLLWQTRFKPPHRMPLILATIVITLGCLPLFPFVKMQTQYQATYGHFSAEGLWSIPTLLLALGKHLTVLLTYKNLILEIIVGVIAGFGLLVGLKGKRDLSLVQFSFIWLAFSFLPFVVIDLLKGTHYIRTSRYFLPMVPVLGFLYVYALENLGRITKQVLSSLIVLVLIANAVLISLGDYARFYGFENTPYQASSRFINTFLVKGDLVLVSNSGVSVIGLSQYLTEQADLIGLPSKNPGKSWRAEELDARLSHLTKNRNRVWVMFKKPSKKLKHQIEQWMVTEFEPLKVKKIQHDTSVTLWRRRS